MIISGLLLFFLLALFYQLAQRKQAVPQTKKFEISAQAQTFPLVYATSISPKDLPLEIPNENRGSSEDYFLQYLWKYFPQYIHVDIALPIKDEFYYPDFAFIDKKKRLFIDIEIDEPYALPFGKPTHYLGSDEIRNRFFLQQGWMVIRFTEEQVVRQPKQCCKFIAHRVAAVTKETKLPDLFYHIDDLSIHQKQWTRRQSEYLFDQRYRDRYKHLLKAKK
ncbi:MAG: hypothetical protein ACFB0B_02790 [Thermonemataceae bacterium]